VATNSNRNQKRTSASVTLQIISSRQPFVPELAFTENISLHGLRIVTERAWEPEERVILRSYGGTVRTRARVIYCHPMSDTRYAVGLELFSAVETWVDNSLLAPMPKQAGA
jgi:hypothetical protein